MPRWQRHQRVEPVVSLVAVERVGSADLYWGPFCDIEDVVTFCRERNCVVTVAVLNVPILEH